MTEYLFKDKKNKRTNMISAGIDVGGKNLHVVIMKDGNVLAKGIGPAGIQKAHAAEKLYDEVLAKAGLKRGDVKHVVATGSAGKGVAFADSYIPDVAADARGMNKLFPSVRTVIDVGAEEGRAIKVNPEGAVLDFAVNEKCAAGTGTFTEAMARALEITVEDMAKIAVMANKSIQMNAQCAVFGESEVVSLIHQKTQKPDIARAVLDAIAERVASVARLVGLEKDVAVIGGMAKNVGFVDSLKKDTGMDIKVPENPDYVGALGAAIAAAVGVTAVGKVKTEVSDEKTVSAGGSPLVNGKTSVIAGGKKEDFWRWPEGIWVNQDLDWEKGKFITAGVDVGSVSTQAVVMVDGEIYSFSNIRTGSDSPDSARHGIDMALGKSDMKVGNIDYCIGTGYGRVNVPMAQQAITEIACHARGANYMYGPEIRTVMDMGGQDCKAIGVDERGKVLNFIMNDKCAAGTGRGMEVFSDLIGVPLWEIGPRSFHIKQEPLMISSTCVVFAKSEVVALLERGVPENEILAAYCAAMAHRITELLHRLGVHEKFVITGGIAKNEGVVKRLEEELGIKTADKAWYKKEMRGKVSFDTQIAGAVGAAIFGFAMLERGKVKSARKA
jgi:benzoyl-CoA reductase subunit A